MRRSKGDVGAAAKGSGTYVNAGALITKDRIQDMGS